jgi:hypothetical protein
VIVPIARSRELGESRLTSKGAFGKAFGLWRRRRRRVSAESLTSFFAECGSFAEALEDKSEVAPRWESVETGIAERRALLERGDVAGAVPLWEQTGDAFPDSPTAFQQPGPLLVQEFGQARSGLSGALERFPGDRQWGFGHSSRLVERVLMRLKIKLSVGALVVAALIAAGLSYWSMRENSQAAASGGPPSLADTSGPPPTITAPAAAPATSQPSRNAPSPAKAAAPAPSQLSQAARQATTTGAAAPKTATSEPNAMSAATTTAPAGVPAMSLPPPSIAGAAPKSLPATALAAKTRLSEADRHQAQQEL